MRGGRSRPGGTGTAISLPSAGRLGPGRAASRRLRLRFLFCSGGFGAGPSPGPSSPSPASQLSSEGSASAGQPSRPPLRAPGPSLPDGDRDGDKAGTALCGLPGDLGLPPAAARGPGCCPRAAPSRVRTSLTGRGIPCSRRRQARVPRPPSLSSPPLASGVWEIREAFRAS